MSSNTVQMRATKLSAPSVARPAAKFAGSSVSSKHSALCGCPACRNVSAKATINIKVNDTKMTLNNVKEGSNVEVDLTPSTAPAPAAAAASGDEKKPFVADADHMKKRTLAVQKHMPGSMAADDYLSRCEVMLCAHGFRGDNSIGVTNLCRDESTGILKNKIEAIFGANFNINGLGAVLTCGATGMGAGLSHAPIDPTSSRERYVFFSFPHIAIDDDGNLGKIYRPGRAGESAACGALLTALSLFQGDGLDAHVKDPGVHDIDEPEFSILKQRVARRIVAEGLNVDKLDIAALTKVAERRITYDLEQLIDAAVDTSKADYAVCTGVQIHSWPDPSTGAPAIEFVMPTKSYVVIDGKRTDIRLDAVPALSPRQLSLLSTGALKEVHPEDQLVNAYLQGSTVVELEQPDPAGNPGLAGVKSAKQNLLFKSTTDGSEQEGHVKPKWADVYCC